MSRRKPHVEEHPDETWLLPYSDLLTLLLALFIVMFSISSIDKEKYASLSRQFSIIFSEGGGILEDGSLIIPLDELQQNNSTIEDEMMMQIKESIDREIKNRGYSENFKTVLNKEGLEIAIQEVVLFNSGEAEILQSVHPLLKEIAHILKKLDNDIKVVGHTDNVPIHTEKYRSNWDLSAMRAINVMHFMVEQGGLAQERFSIQGYGEFAPKYDNSTEEGRAKNRRVEIFVARKYPLANEG
jgi:chemotaxis protein MotB